MAGTGLSRWGRERAPLGSTRSGSPEVPFMTTSSFHGRLCGRAAAGRAARSGGGRRPGSCRADHPSPSRTRPACRCADAPDVMVSAFGGSDADGAWDWKTAYDACEAATVLFLRKFGPAMLVQAASPAGMLPMLAKIAGLLPTHTRRSEESQALQQFSTPIALGLAASTAAAITPADLVLEPSAGTGLSPSSPNSRAGRSFSMSWPRRAQGCWTICSLASPSPATTPRRSMIISTLRRPERRADEPAILGAGECRSPHGRRRPSPCRLGVGASCRGWAAGRDHRRELRARQSSVDRCLCPAAGARADRLLGRHRRLGLCQAWHDHRHAPDRDRPVARTRSDASGFTRLSPPTSQRCLAGSRIPFRHGCRSPRRSSPAPRFVRRRTAAARCAAPFLRPGHDARAGGG